jgi:DNA-binding response OmpR family regulator
MPRLLIIDDDSDLRAVLRATLEKAGHEVLEAGDGNQGIKIFQQQPINLVLCDLVMSGKEGLETIRDLRRQQADVKIIAMSGGLFGWKMNMLPVAEKLGAAKTLRKPFDVATLLSAVEELLQVPKST